MTELKPVVAIDGPSGSGKSTVARMLSRRLGYTHLDTGAMYRAVALAAVRNEISLDDGPSLNSLCEKLRIELVAKPEGVLVYLNGEDVTDQWPNEKITRLYQEAGYGVVTQYKSALVDQMRTASSFLKHVLAIYYDTNEEHTCVTGVEGLPGGYPTRLSREGAEVVLPGISREEAIRINEEGGKIDGIEKIKDDGTVVFCDKNVEYMREVVGYECKELKPSESEERARELNTLLKKLYDKYNVEA